MSWHLVAKAAAHMAKKKVAKTLSEPGRRSLSRGFVVAAAIVTAPLGLILLVVMLSTAAVVAAAPVVAGGGALGIPPVVFAAYIAAETNAASIAYGCAADWPIIAGIWKVESGHATHRGRSVDLDGQVTPPIYGITLDGSQPNTAVIADSDDGLLDGDPTWDRAVGPAQFLPGSWHAFGHDGNADGLADPHNVFDAALSTVAHLCLASPGEYTNQADLTRALGRYNNSAEYVATVSAWIDYYRAFRFTQGAITADGLYAFPLPIESVTVDQVRHSHHDYPASDLAVPEGTPVYAAHPGTVTGISTPCDDPERCRCGWGVHITGADSHAYTYCHGTQINVEAGTEVTAGQLIMTSGNTGNSTSPHLHFQIRNPDGVLVCPQGPLEAWWNGVGLSPVAAPTDGCTH